MRADGVLPGQHRHRRKWGIQSTRPSVAAIDVHQLPAYHWPFFPSESRRWVSRWRRSKTVNSPSQPLSLPVLAHLSLCAAAWPSSRCCQCYSTRSRRRPSPFSPPSTRPPRAPSPSRRVPQLRPQPPLHPRPRPPPRPLPWRRVPLLCRRGCVRGARSGKGGCRSLCWLLHSVHVRWGARVFQFASVDAGAATGGGHARQ